MANTGNKASSCVVRQPSAMSVPFAVNIFSGSSCRNANIKDRKDLLKVA